MNLDSGFQVLIANLYPPCPQPDLVMGIPPHSDHGLLTLLTQNGIGGLQLLHNGKWVNVNALSNSFLVNTGDHVEVTNSILLVFKEILLLKLIKRAFACLLDVPADSE